MKSYFVTRNGFSLTFLLLTIIFEMIWWKVGDCGISGGAGDNDDCGSDVWCALVPRKK